LITFFKEGLWSWGTSRVFTPSYLSAILSIIKANIDPKNEIPIKINLKIITKLIIINKFYYYYEKKKLPK